MKLFTFSKPDERTWVLHYRAGSIAGGVMILCIVTIGGYLVFSKSDVNTGEILMGWLILVGIYALIKEFKVSAVAREELTRDAVERKKSLRRFYYTLTLLPVYWFCIYYFLMPSQQTRSLKSSIFIAVWMTVWLSGFNWWLGLRKFRNKKGEQ